MANTYRRRLWWPEIDALSVVRRPFRAPNVLKLTAPDRTGSIKLPVRHPGRYWQNRHIVTDGLSHPVRILKVARRARRTK